MMRLSTFGLRLQRHPPVLFSLPKPLNNIPSHHFDIPSHYVHSISFEHKKCFSNRKYSTGQEEEEEEEDEEVKLKRKLEKIKTPFIYQALVPRRRRGLTVETFLKKIGKECDQYADKFKSWEDLFVMPSKAMKDLGIPTKQRRWILHWVHRYRQGDTPGLERVS